MSLLGLRPIFISIKKYLITFHIQAQIDYFRLFYIHVRQSTLNTEGSVLCRWTNIQYPTQYHCTKYEILVVDNQCLKKMYNYFT